MYTQLLDDFHIYNNHKMYFLTQLFIALLEPPPPSPTYITANWKLNSLLVKPFKSRQQDQFFYFESLHYTIGRD